MIPSTSKNKNGIITRTTFDLKKDLKFQKLTSVTNLTVQNGEMLAAIADKVLVHHTDGSGDRPQEMSIPLQSPDHVAHIHVSENGFHAIVSSKLGHNFYVHMKTNTIHHLKKIRCQVSAVGWNPEYTKEEDTTGPILLGSSQGSIVEINIGSNGLVTCLKEMTSQVALIGEQKMTGAPSPAAAVTDIQLFQLSDDDPKTRKWMVIIAQMARLIVLLTDSSSDPPAPAPKLGGFTSSASLQAGLMNLGTSSEQTPPTQFHSLFNSALQHTISSSKFSEKFKNHGFLALYPNENPSRYAWLSPDGISIGRANIQAEKIADVLVEEFNIEHRLIEGRLEPPTGIALTEFHVLLAYSSRVLALSLLPPHDVAFEDPWTPDLGLALGFSTDKSTDYTWLFTPTQAMKYGTNDEARYIWKTYLDRGDFKKAVAIARTRQAIEPDALEMALRKHAEFYIQQKNYTAAAEILAESSEPFESVVLKFLTNSSERKMGLKTLLDKKLERLTRPEDRIRRDALVMWLLNVQLEELAEMRRIRQTHVEMGEKLKDTTDHVQRYFMRKNVFESIQTNREAVYRMCIGHADFDMQLFFAHACKDLRTEIDIFMLREQYMEVLEVLKSQRICDLTYEMLPLLIEHIPKQCFIFLVQNMDGLVATKLLATLTLCVKNMEMATPAIKFLEMYFKNFPSPQKQLHNVYIHLMAKFRPERLQSYLESHGTNRSDIPYDLDFAMRTAEQFLLAEPIVFLFCVAGLFGDAVDKALLTGDVDLAKKCAGMMEEAEFQWIDALEGPQDFIRPKLDEKVKKTTWLKIAEWYIQREETEKGIGMIEESNHLITIQDLLPILPKFTKIGELKEVIVDFLKRNKERMEKLDKAMKEATSIASEIRDKQEKLKNRTTVVKPSDVCSHCTRPLAGRPFNVHSCRHFFHRECLEQAMIPFLSRDDVTEMKRLIGEEERVVAQLKAEQMAGNMKGVKEKEEKYSKIAMQISGIVGAECPLCGDIAISLIDKPFMSDEEFAADLNTWIL